MNYDSYIQHGQSIADAYAAQQAAASTASSSQSSSTTPGVVPTATAALSKAGNNFGTGTNFIPHMMYDPETGKSYYAETESLHLEYQQRGYTHTPPESIINPAGTKVGNTVQLQISEASPVPSNFDAYGYPQKVTIGGIILTRIEETRKDYIKASRAVFNREATIKMSSTVLFANRDDVKAGLATRVGEEISAKDAIDTRRRTPSYGMFVFGDQDEAQELTNRTAGPHGYIYLTDRYFSDKYDPGRLNIPLGNNLGEILSPDSPTAGYYGKTSFVGTEADGTYFNDLTKFNTDIGSDLNYFSIPLEVTSDDSNFYNNGVALTTYTNYATDKLQVSTNYAHIGYADTPIHFSYMRDPLGTDIEYKWIVSDVVYDEGTGTFLDKDPTILIGSKASIDRAAILVPTRDPKGTVTSVDIVEKGQYNGTGKRTINGLVYSGMNPPEIIVRVSEEEAKLDIQGKPLDPGKNDGGDSGSKLAIAAGLAVLPKVNISKCVDLPEINIETGLDKLKASLDGAVNKAGLDKLMGKLDNLKADLEANLPKLPELPDFASQLAALDPTNLEAVQALKDKWGDIVSGIDDLVDGLSLPNFDICAVKDQKIVAEVQEDGTYKEKVIAEEPTLPAEAPVEDTPVSELVETVEVQDEPEDEFQVKFSITPKQAMEGYKAWTQNYKLTRENIWFRLNMLDERDKAQEDLNRLLVNRKYDAFVGYRKNTFGGPVGFEPRLGRQFKDVQFMNSEKRLYTIIYRLNFRDRLIAAAQNNVKKYIRNNTYEILSSEDPGSWSDIILGRLPRTLQAGSNINATAAIVTEELSNELMEMYPEIKLFAKERLWKKDLVLGLARYYAVSGLPGVTLDES
jgi:hypothetical protein